jgi:hypothetical protein
VIDTLAVVCASSLFYYMAEKNKKGIRRKKDFDDIDTSETEDEQMYLTSPSPGVQLIGLFPQSVSRYKVITGH